MRDFRTIRGRRDLGQPPTGLMGAQYPHTTLRVTPEGVSLGTVIWADSGDPGQHPKRAHKIHKAGRT
jgi:hypothetical protein